MGDNDVKVLLDTNILIQAEDNRLIEEKFADFFQKCYQYSIQLFLHQGTKEDIERDKNIERKKIILSKIKKYQILGEMSHQDKASLEKKYGKINKINDFIDIKLLDTLLKGAVNFLVTEDIGLHKRAENIDSLDNRVFFILEALDWIKQTYEPKTIHLPHVFSSRCHQIDTTQEIFTSLKNDYPEFDEWFQKCIARHRDCWVVKEDDIIIAIAIWKKETGKEVKEDIIFESDFRNEIQDSHNILKICTFKVDLEARGSKIGELLLKQSLWYAQENKFDWIYLTVYEEKHPYLLSFLEEFGFFVRGRNRNKEIFIIKQMLHSGKDLGKASPLEFHKIFYPSYYDGGSVQKFIVPIQPDFHFKLFPEYTKPALPQLFPYYYGEKVSRQISGNTIKKVYVSRASTNQIKEGDLIFFYISKNEQYVFSQSLTIVGVVDKVTICDNLQTVLQATAKRSVYSHDDLANMFSDNVAPVKVMDFLIEGHIKSLNDELLTLKELSKIDINNPPQSITLIPEEKYQKLKNIMCIVHGTE